MPDRSSFKSKFTCDEGTTASGMLSSISINANIDDAKQHLLESITNAQAKYSELRLGQILINALNCQQPYPELFHVEDNVLAEKLSQISL
jgi:hypothetical protein